MTLIPAEHTAELAQCYVALARRVFGYARSALGVDGGRAEDLVQQAFETLAMRWAELREQPEANRLRFLCAVVWCDVVDYARRDNKAREKQPEVWRSSWHPQNDPFEAVHLQLLIDAFNKEVSEMPPQRRRVSELKWGRQLSNQEIAATLGLSDKAVSSHIAAARAALRRVRELLEDEDVSAPEGGSDR